MLLLILNVLFVIVAVSMVALILMQRGAGAQAGSGFGGGASATVFGARGSSSFLTKATKWLAIAFFAITLFMAWHATRMATAPVQAGTDLGVMSQTPAPPAAAPGQVPQAPPASVPLAPQEVPSSVPAAPVQEDSTATPPQGD